MDCVERSFSIILSFDNGIGESAEILSKDASEVEMLKVKELYYEIVAERYRKQKESEYEQLQ